MAVPSNSGRSPPGHGRPPPGAVAVRGGVPGADVSAAGSRDIRTGRLNGDIFLHVRPQHMCAHQIIQPRKVVLAPTPGKYAAGLGEKRMLTQGIQNTVEIGPEGRLAPCLRLIMVMGGKPVFHEALGSVPPGLWSGMVFLAPFSANGSGMTTGVTGIMNIPPNGGFRPRTVRSQKDHIRPH